MAYEERARGAARPHGVVIEERERLSVTGVEDVERFDEDEIILLTNKGSLNIRGSGLHIGRLSLESGELSVEGLVTELCYEESAPSGSLWSRLFG